MHRIGVPAASRLRRAAPLAISIAAAVWAFAAWRRSPALLDDAFISYRYAYNFAHGAGLVFNAGERVAGYTNFLWTLVAAAAIKLGRDPLAVTQSLGVAAYASAVALAAWIAVSGRPWGLRLLPGLALVALLVLQTGVASFAGTGLETSFVGLLILAIGVVHHLVPRQRAGWRLLASVLPLAVVLTRLDAGLAIAASAATSVAVRSDRDERSLGHALLERFGPALIGVGAYLIWSRSYYGDWLPNTYYAKQADGLHAEVGAAYLIAFVQSCPASLVVAIFIACGLAVARGPQKAFLSYVATAAVLQLAYAVKVGGDFMEYRFMWEYWPAFVSGGIVGVQVLAARMLPAALVGAALAVGVAPIPPVLEKKYGMQSLPQMDGYAHLAVHVGTALERALPRGTAVATTLAGTSYFMPDVNVIDQWGLNDRFVAHMRLHRYIEIEGLNARGHLKYAPLEYLRARGVNLYIEHPTVCDCDHPCREDKPDVFVRLGSNDECVRTWYMTQTADLTQWFCSHPDEFVLDKVQCPAE